MTIARRDLIDLPMTRSVCEMIESNSTSATSAQFLGVTAPRGLAPGRKNGSRIHSPSWLSIGTQ